MIAAGAIRAVPRIPHRTVMVIKLLRTSGAAGHSCHEDIPWVGVSVHKDVLLVGCQKTVKR